MKTAKNSVTMRKYKNIITAATFLLKSNLKLSFRYIKTKSRYIYGARKNQPLNRPSIKEI